MQKTAFCVTDNQAKPQEYWLEKHEKKGWYIIGQYEEGSETKHRHFQCYVEVPKKRTVGAMRKELHPMHVEPRRGSQKQAIEYVTKKETRVEGPYTYGEPSHQGQRTDLEDFRDAVIEGASKAECYTDYMPIMARYRHLRADIIDAFATPRDWVTEVHVIWGESGKGKSRSVWDAYGKNAVYDAPVEKGAYWFNNYEQQPIILFDEFEDSKMARGQWLKLTDRYPMQVPVKNGFVNWAPKKIYFTCQYEPTFYGMTPEIRRRITSIKSITEINEEKERSAAASELESSDSLPLA